MGHLSSLSKMEHLCVILLLLYSTNLPAAVTDPDVPVVGEVGKDLVLPSSIKPLNATDMEVIWSGERGVVHHYKNHMDKLEEQHPDYRGRTSLFGPLKLQEGNASLKISSFRVSDAQNYTCEINSQTAHITTQYVIVEAVGSIPVITKESLRNGSVNLQCESTGWSTEPQVEWRNSSNQRFSANPTIFQKSEGRVISRVRVERSNGTSFTCRVWTQRFSKQMHTEVDEKLFDIPGIPRWAWILMIFLLLLLCIVICKLIPWRRLWHWWNNIIQRHKIPQELKGTTTEESVSLKWEMGEPMWPCISKPFTPKFHIQVTPKGGKCSEPQTSTELSIDIKSLKPGTEYKVRACAVICEKEYPWSDSYSFITNGTNDGNVFIEDSQPPELAAMI